MIMGIFFCWQGWLSTKNDIVFKHKSAINLYIECHILGTC